MWSLVRNVSTFVLGIWYYWTHLLPASGRCKYLTILSMYVLFIHFSGICSSIWPGWGQITEPQNDCWCGQTNPQGIEVIHTTFSIGAMFSHIYSHKKMWANQPNWNKGDAAADDYDFRDGYKPVVVEAEEKHGGFTVYPERWQWWWKTVKFVLMITSYLWWWR